MCTENVHILSSKQEMEILSPFQTTLEQWMIWVDYSTHCCHLLINNMPSARITNDLCTIIITHQKPLSQVMMQQRKELLWWDQRWKWSGRQSKWKVLGGWLDLSTIKAWVTVECRVFTDNFNAIFQHLYILWTSTMHQPKVSSSPSLVIKLC